MAFADLQAAVAAQTSVVQSVITLLEGLSAKLAEALANGVDAAAIEALKAEIDANTTALAAAVTTNTPSA